MMEGCVTAVTTPASGGQHAAKLCRPRRPRRGHHAVRMFCPPLRWARPARVAEHSVAYRPARPARRVGEDPVAPAWLRRQYFKEPRETVSTARRAEATGRAVRIKPQSGRTIHVQSHEVVKTVESSIGAGVGQGSALNPGESVHDMMGIAVGQQGSIEDSAI